MKTKSTALAIEDEKQVNLWPYVMLFGVIYFVGLAVVAAIDNVFDLFGNASYGVNLAILFVSAGLAVRKFVLEHHRPFERREQLRFAFLAFVFVIVVDVVLVGLFVLIGGGFEEIAQEMNELSATLQEQVLVIAIALLVIYLVEFALLYFLSGTISRTLSKMLAEKGKI